MHIRHSNPHTSGLSHAGREYKAVRDGIFEVPNEVGHELVQRAEWEQYFGEVPYEVSSEESSADEPRRARSRSQKAPAE